MVSRTDRRAESELGVTVKLSDLTRIVVGVDPAITSGDDADETGIVIVGKGPHQPSTCVLEKCRGHGYVLGDYTIPQHRHPTVDAWARRVVEAFDDFSADRVVAEGNQGGELVESVLRTVRPSLPITRVHAKHGKRTRAEPVAALYEQGRCHHVGSPTEFAVLEDQLTTWTQDSGESPDRLDALVWAVTELKLVNYGQGQAFIELWKRQTTEEAKPPARQRACTPAYGPPVGDKRYCQRCGRSEDEHASPDSQAQA